jgi:hypothetical protein
MYKIGERINIDGIGFGTVYDETEKHLFIMTEYGHIVQVVKGLLNITPERTEMTAPKFKIDDKVFLKKFRKSVPSVITTVTKSRGGSFFYLLDDDTYDDHGINDWERQEDLIHENEYTAFLEREKQSKINELKNKVAELDRQIKELEKCQS